MTTPVEQFDDAATVRRRSDVFAADSDGEMVVLDSERGDFLHLNKTAGRIFALLDGPKPVVALRDRLIEHFDVDAETCREDLKLFLAQLAERGLVEIVPAEAGS